MPGEMRNEALNYWRASRLFRCAVYGTGDCLTEVTDALDEIDAIVTNTEWERLRNVAAKTIQTVSLVPPLAKSSRSP